MNMSANFFKAAGASQAQGGSALENANAATQPDVAATPVQGAAQPTAAATSPLASFDKLWENAPTGDAKKPTGVLPAITAEQLSTTLANSNFLANIAPELITKAAGGDAAAFSDVINQGLRTVMTQSVLASHGLVEAGARSHGEQLKATLPTMVRSSSVSDSLQSNPLYTNPAVRPVIDNVRTQLETKFPQASAREIASMTDAYFADLSKAFTGQNATAANGGKTPTQGDEETNWFEVLGLDTAK